MTGTEPTSTASADAEPNTGLAHAFDDVLTLPNLITLVRLLCLPLFLWLLFVQEDRQNAAWLLGALGATDWVDGYIARRYDMVSEFGKIFDPFVDRLLFIVATTAILIEGAMPVWFGVTLLVREILVGLMMAVATVVYKIPRIPVTFLGKAGTFLLMWAVPGFLLRNSDFVYADGILVATWIIGVPGLVLSLYTGFAYIPKVRAGLAASRGRSATTISAND